MTLGQKLGKLRALAGHTRGLGREMTQSEVSKAILQELDGKISQSYLSQLESGARPHLTGGTRLLLARFFHVHPGYLVDDLESSLPSKPRHKLDDQLDVWLIEGSEGFAVDRALSNALLKIAKHEKSRDCLVWFGSIVENRSLMERLITDVDPPHAPRRRPRR
ncbi:MAG TPA: helix-turn-helix transcriptional regulator [Thermoanaerobaculia bacterium]|nr:helix-turn-helix transcriptional regulator [Thermoanaerobaculia bacterium]